MRRFSTLVTKSSPRPHPWTVASTSNTADDDDSDALSESKVSAFTVTRDESSRPAPSLKVKRVDHYFSRWTKSWKYRVSRPPHLFSLNTMNDTTLSEHGCEGHCGEYSDPAERE